MIYEDIADEEMMEGLLRELFIDYMTTRWPDPEEQDIKCRTGYATAWAQRFQKGTEWIYSDLKGRRILAELCPYYLTIYRDEVESVMKDTTND